MPLLDGAVHEGEDAQEKRVFVAIAGPDRPNQFGPQLRQCVAHGVGSFGRGIGKHASGSTNGMSPEPISGTHPNHPSLSSSSGGTRFSHRPKAITPPLYKRANKAPVLSFSVTGFHFRSLMARPQRPSHSLIVTGHAGGPKSSVHCASSPRNSVSASAIGVLREEVDPCP